MNTNETPREARLQRRIALMNSDRQPYPESVGTPIVFDSLRQTYADLAPNVVTDDAYVVAGRVMFMRSGGNIAFVTLQAGDGTRLQLILMADVLGAMFTDDSSQHRARGKAALKEFFSLVDLGDHVAARGVIMTSIKGELSLRVDEWTMASKALEPLPFLHAELNDENRRRRPYLDLIQSQPSRDRVRMRSRIVREMRRYFEDCDYVEIDVPVLQPVHGGAQARPFTTHVNALDQDFSLRIAHEIPLKKALVGGLDRVFSMGPVFRNEGIDSSHSPEFSLLESYQAWGDQRSQAEHVQCMFRRICAQVGGVGNNAHAFEMADGTVIDFAPEWRWLSVYDGVSEAVSATVDSSTTAEQLRLLCDEHEVSYDGAWPAGKLVMALCSALVEPTLIQPTFLHDWPAEAQPLARRNDADVRRIQAWDLIINGGEMGTGFSELADPILQRQILTEQSLLAAGGDLEAMQLDEDFLEALSYSMPPAGGLGLGIDRVVAFFTRSNVRDAILFPLVRRTHA